MSKGGSKGLSIGNEKSLFYIHVYVIKEVKGSQYMYVEED